MNEMTRYVHEEDFRLSLFGMEILGPPIMDGAIPWAK